MKIKMSTMATVAGISALSLMAYKKISPDMIEDMKCKMKKEATKNKVALIIIKGMLKEGMEHEKMLKEMYETLKGNKWTKDIQLIEKESSMTK
jgi:nitrogen regulatory protein PII-like uncharacterized protein